MADTCNSSVRDQGGGQCDEETDPTSSSSSTPHNATSQPDTETHLHQQQHSHEHHQQQQQQQHTTNGTIASSTETTVTANGATVSTITTTSAIQQQQQQQQQTIESSIAVEAMAEGQSPSDHENVTGSTSTTEFSHHHPTSALSLAISGNSLSGPSTPSTIHSINHSSSLSGSTGHLTSEFGHEPPDTKEGMDELCPVCGDKVSGYHYGLLTCESCKGFFKRTVQNKKVYTCVAERNCHIDKSQRKRCPYCRFQKCLDVGMKLEAVRADRMRGGRNKFGPMYKRDRARRLQLMRQRQMHRGIPGTHGGGHHTPDGSASSSGSPFVVAALNNGGGGGNGGLTSQGTIYSPNGIKQELIQIPQLSSSTSSPDSSPLPGQNIAHNSHQSVHYTATGSSVGNGNSQSAMMHSAAAAAAVALQPTGLSSGGAHAELVKWIGSNQSTSATGGIHHGKLPHGPPRTSYLLDANNSTTSSALVPAGSTFGVLALEGPAAASAVKIPPILRELQCTAPDDKDWRSHLNELLTNQTHNQCEVDLFELMCKVIDQSLFAQVDWARNSIFFKDLKVDDQMKLLQNSWSDLLVLDHLYQRMHYQLPDEIQLANGQKFDLLSLAMLGNTAEADSLNQVQNRLMVLKLDSLEYLCLKFLLLLNPDVPNLTNFRLVREAHDQAKQALLEYTVHTYPMIPDKFHQLMDQIPRLRLLTVKGEEYLYYKHLENSTRSETLLAEMLVTKKRN